MDILELIGQKAFFKFRNVKDAFRTIDQDRSGSVEKQEMQAFFRQFSLPEETASLLFDYLDRDESGELDYVEFMRHFGPIIQPGVPPPVTYRNPLAGDGGAGNNHNYVAGISLCKSSFRCAVRSSQKSSLENPYSGTNNDPSEFR